MRNSPGYHQVKCAIHFTCVIASNTPFNLYLQIRYLPRFPEIRSTRTLLQIALASNNSRRNLNLGVYILITPNPTMFDLILQAFGVLFLVSVVSYFVPFFLISLRSPQNLAKKYPDAKWAMVTGGSSGIGRAIVERLASQGIQLRLDLKQG